MWGNRDRHRKHFIAVVLGLTVLVLMPAVGLAQGVEWEVPEGYEPPADPPIPPPIPLLLVGPITFDESEFQPEGTDMSNTVVTTLDGVPLDNPLTFMYDGPEATTGPGPGVTALLTRPVIRTTDLAGTYDIDFGGDVTEVAFAAAIRCGSQETGEVIVNAFDSGDSLVGTTSENLTDMGFFFLEGMVDFAPGVFRRIEITWSATEGCDRWAIDNLSYDAIPTAPTMGSGWLAVLALVMLAAGTLLLRRRATS